MTTHVALQRPAERGQGFVEFVVLMAALMALGAQAASRLKPT
jgi:hypothetical protein